VKGFGGFRNVLTLMRSAIDPDKYPLPHSDSTRESADLKKP